MTTVDQQKIMRARTELIAHDPARAQPGCTFFTPMFGGGTLYLVDMEGKVAHRWHMAHRPGLYGYLLDLLCLRPLPSEVVSRVQGGLPGTEANGAMYGDCLLEMTTSGDVVWAWRSWEHLDPATHRCPISDLLLN